MSWSLSVEQFCYILGPVLLYLFIRFIPSINRKKLFLWVTCGIICAVLLIRFWFHETHQLASIYEWNENLRKVSMYRLDAIYYGFLAYYLYVNFPISASLTKLLFVFGILGIFTLHLFIFYWGISFETHPGFFNVFYLSLNSVSICSLMPYLFTITISSTPVLKGLTLLSVLSYSIYLLHYTIILHSMKVLVPSDHLEGIPLLLYTLVYWLIILVFSYLLYRFFERPMTDLRERK
ncbi:acyltransferase family protein [Flavobacterium piscinae]|uniref:acyltransferase family protein n=1 Tax=Flavobacterium piscinae TaxID=2506424 RepID=UPI0037096B2F